MVFGIITAVAAVPAIVGTTEAIRYGQKNNAREQHRGRKSHLVVTLPVRNSYSSRFDGAMIVLKDNKLYIDTEFSRLGMNMAHPFTGYFLPYPSRQDDWKRAGFRHGEGMVTTINDENFLNWVYLNSETYEVKYGVRAEAEPHHVGPWDCTPVDHRLTFEGWECFVAVEEEEDSDLWALYCDRDDDGLRGEGKVGTQGKRMLLVDISRKEKRRTKLNSDEERIEQIRSNADKEKKAAEAEIGQDQDEKKITSVDLEASTEPSTLPGASDAAKNEELEPESGTHSTCTAQHSSQDHDDGPTARPEPPKLPKISMANEGKKRIERSADQKSPQHSRGLSTSSSTSASGTQMNKAFANIMPLKHDGTDITGTEGTHDEDEDEDEAKPGANHYRTFSRYLERRSSASSSAFYGSSYEMSSDNHESSTTW